MITDILLLAATDTNSVGYRVGQVLGIILSVLVLLGIPALFIFCLIKLVNTKKKGWLYGVIATALPILGFFGLIAYGAYTGVKGSFASGSAKTAAVATASSRKVEVANADISVVLPGDWVDLDDLNEDADLGAGNLGKEQYFLIMAEVKIDFDGDLSEYSELTAGGMFDVLEGATITEGTNIIFNGLPAIQREISGSIDNANICYLHTSIESKGYFYQALGWTLKSRKMEAFPVFETVLESITENASEGSPTEGDN